MRFLQGFKFTVKGKVVLRVLTQKVMRNSLEVRFEVEVRFETT
jgi:hypothetical protein